MNHTEAFAEFEKQIREIDVVDYGDFKRKANTCMQRLEESFSHPTPPFAKFMGDLRDFVIFSPTLEIEDTRLEILRKAKEISSQLEK